jgi:adenylate cyclase
MMLKHSGFFILVIVALLIAVLEMARPIDFRVLDLQFRLLRSWVPRPVTPDVVIVGVDDESTRRLPEPVTLWHRHLGRFLSALAVAKPAAVGVDIVLPDRSFDAVVPGADKLLMQGLLEARRTYPLVLALTVDPAGKPRAIYPPFLTISGPGSAGYALFPVDGDGRVRRFDERFTASCANDR